VTEPHAATARIMIPATPNSFIEALHAIVDAAIAPPSCVIMLIFQRPTTEEFLKFLSEFRGGRGLGL
jgi:hypothetical protein